MEAAARTFDVEGEVRALLDSYFGAIRATDLERITAHYAPDVVAYDAIGEFEFAGLAAYKAHWKACLEMCQNMTFEPRETVVAASGDVAFAHCLIRCGGTGLDVGGEDLGDMDHGAGLRRRSAERQHDGRGGDAQPGRPCCLQREARVAGPATGRTRLAP
jgi:ketosteroid isomerase-like protein